MEDLAFPSSSPRPHDHHRFRLIFEAAPFAILVADDDGRYVDANPMACQLFGLPRDQLLGRSVYDFVDREDLPPTRAQWQTFRAARSSTGEFRLVRPDGERRLLRYRALADAAPGLHLSFLEDVTEARAAEAARTAAQDIARRALVASESRFRTLADGLPLVIWLGDEEGRSLYLNRHWFEYTGLPHRPDEPDGVESAMHPDDRERVLPLLREGRQRGLPLELTFRIRRHDGEYRWHLSRSLSLRDDGGRIIRRLASATEIEDERRAADGLRQERELRERFVATLSHDLRSPLAAVKMGAQLILRRPDQPDACQVLAGRIERNAEHADRLIQNLLDASRITAGEPLPIRPLPCDLGGLAEAVLADQTTIHGDRFRLVSSGDLQGRFDAEAVRRLLENLLGNAIKFGDGHAPVVVRLDGRDGQLTLAVRNQGHPIAAEERSRIFTPYHRARSAAPGWGLGLTLVRGVAEAHGGSVGVESSQEAGTTFLVTLPRGDL